MDSTQGTAWNWVAVIYLHVQAPYLTWKHCSVVIWIRRDASRPFLLTGNFLSVMIFYFVFVLKMSDCEVTTARIVCYWSRRGFYAYLSQQRGLYVYCPQWRLCLLVAAWIVYLLVATARIVCLLPAVNIMSTGRSEDRMPTGKTIFFVCWCVPKREKSVRRSRS